MSGAAGSGTAGKRAGGCGKLQQALEVLGNMLLSSPCYRLCCSGFARCARSRVAALAALGLLGSWVGGSSSTPQQALCVTKPPTSKPTVVSSLPACLSTALPSCCVPPRCLFPVQNFSVETPPIFLLSCGSLNT